MTDEAAVTKILLDRYGRTYAEQAGIRLADKPAPLYQLQVLSLLMSARVRAEVAVSAASELFGAGCTTPRKMVAASWQDRVDALGSSVRGRAGQGALDKKAADAVLEAARG